MLDFNAPEFLVVAIVALLVIGPKDLPKAMRFVGKWVGKARGVARQFRSGFDSMVREAELAEMEKQWAAENERIMREHPVASLPSPQPEHFDTEPFDAADAPPVMVEQPEIAEEAQFDLLGEPAVAPKAKRARKSKGAAAGSPAE
ncbi:Sec-independent protein translocase protein TatB [Sphingomonas soli]|uniref:Sec-independent protein translocase protein TatB n=1 Tax=Sphingomonas soli TaxID=266127 RepID=UPI00082CD09E|nr:Sec-independent protein translocase protein TatB [Sphingomonas soli]